MSGRWYSDRYRDAVWEAEGLNAYEKALAEVHGRFARTDDGQRGPSADLAAVAYPVAMKMGGIGRRENVTKAAEGLVAKGWLVVVREVPRRPTLYRLAIPAEVRSSDVGTTETDATGTTETVAGSDVGTTETGSGEATSSGVGTTGAEAGEAASSDVGTSLVPQWNYGSSDVGTLLLGLVTKPPPPTPSTDPPAPSGAGEREEGEDSDLEKRKGNLVLAVRGIKKFWGRHRVQQTIEEALADDRPLALIELAFLIVAADPKTTSPRRLLADGPWWQQAAAELYRGAPAAPVDAGTDEEWCSLHPDWPGRTAKGTLRCLACRKAGLPESLPPAGVAPVIDLVPRLVS